MGRSQPVTKCYRCPRPKCTRRCGGSSAVSFQTPHDTINKQTTTDGYETTPFLAGPGLVRRADTTASVAALQFSLASQAIT